MSTINPIRVGEVERGAVQKHFVSTRILSGFMPVRHFESLAGEYLAMLDASKQAEVLGEAQATRTFVSQLSPFQPSSIITREIKGPYVDAIKADPLFVKNYGESRYTFCYVNPSSIIALQTWLESRAGVVPTEEAELFEFALPRTWHRPVEISYDSEETIYVLSSIPCMQRLEAKQDETTGKVTISAEEELNLIEVAHFEDRYYLRNGYHRVADALVAGTQEIPAIVVEAASPDDVVFPGVYTAFDFDDVLKRKRPPLVQDFHTSAALTIGMREVITGFITKTIAIKI